MAEIDKIIAKKENDLHNLLEGIKKEEEKMEGVKVGDADLRKVSKSLVARMTPLIVSLVQFF